jgi:glutamine synthetase-like protein
MPDPSCNPYLALAVMLAAGLDGVERKLDPGPSVNKNIFTMSHREKRRLRIGQLPANLSEALDEMERDEVVKEPSAITSWRTTCGPSGRNGRTTSRTSTPESRSGIWRSTEAEGLCPTSRRDRSRTRAGMNSSSHDCGRHFTGAQGGRWRQPFALQTNGSHHFSAS